MGGPFRRFRSALDIISRRVLITGRWGDLTQTQKGRRGGDPGSRWPLKNGAVDPEKETHRVRTPRRNFSAETGSPWSAEGPRRQTNEGHGLTIGGDLRLNPRSPRHVLLLGVVRLHVAGEPQLLQPRDWPAQCGPRNVELWWT